MKFVGVSPELAFGWVQYYFECKSLQNQDFQRMQKRLLHLIGQCIELGICNGNVDMSALPHQVSAVAENSFKATAVVRLDASMTRTQAANVIRAELIRRFLAKPSGFVAGAKHSDNADLKEATRNNNVGNQAAAQYITSYMALAQQSLLQKFTKQKFLHMSYYHDASKVCTFEAPSVLDL